MQNFNTHIYGFRKHRTATDITGLVEAMLYLNTNWQGLHTIIACQDVRFAFDSMDHETTLNAFKASGASKTCMTNQARELSNIKAHITIDGAPDSDPFHFTMGGKQGGPMTPDDWNILLNHHLVNLFRSWANRGARTLLREHFHLSRDLGRQHHSFRPQLEHLHHPSLRITQGHHQRQAGVETRLPAVPGGQGHGHRTLLRPHQGQQGPPLRARGPPQPPWREL